MNASLRFADEPYRLLFERHPLPMWVFDPRTLAILAVNEAAIRHYGFSREEFLSLTIRELRPAEEVARLAERVDRLRDTDERGSPIGVGLWKHRRKDGSLIDVEASWTRTGFGNTDAVLVLAVDVTARQRMEAERRQADERLAFDSQILAHIHDAVVATDRSGRITFWNASAEWLYGHGADEVLGRPAGEILPDSWFTDPGFLPRNVSIRSMECAQLTRNGTRIYVEATVSRLRDPNGQQAGLLAIVRDVTERRQAAEALRQSREHLRAVIEGAPVILWTTARDGTMRMIEGTDANGVPFRGDEMIGRPVGDLFPRQPQVGDFLRRANETGHLTEVLRVGSQTYDVRCAPLTDPDGRRDGVIGVAMDVTQREEALEELRRSRAYLRAVVEALPVILWVTDTKGRLELILGKMTEELPVSPPELVGRSLLEFFGSDPTLYGFLRRVLETDGCHEFLEVGGRIYEIRTNWLRNADGSFRGVTGVSTDVTVAKRGERARVRTLAGLQRLAVASLHINSADSFEHTARVIAEQARSLIGARQAFVQVLPAGVPTGETLTASLSAEYAAPPDFDVAALVPRLDRLREPLRKTVAQTSTEPSWRELAAERPRWLPLRGWLAAPLLRGNQTVGSIQLSDPQASDFEASDQAFLAQLAQTASVALENVRLLDELRRAREQLQALSWRLVDLQETERRTIARELHDEIGQTLTALNLSLGVAAREDRSRGAVAGLQEALALTSELLTRVREMSMRLRPSMLDDLGLVPTLLWHLDRFTSQTGIRVSFRHGDLPGRFDRVVEVAAYRIVQEALTNVARHSGATEATVRLWADDGWLGIQIEDPGRGFDSALLAGANSTGLNGMRERATLLGGQLSVDSGPGSGCIVYAEIPIRSTTGQAAGSDR